MSAFILYVNKAVFYERKMIRLNKVADFLCAEADTYGLTGMPGTILPAEIRVGKDDVPESFRFIAGKQDGDVFSGRLLCMKARQKEQNFILLYALLDEAVYCLPEDEVQFVRRLDVGEEIDFLLGKAKTFDWVRRFRLGKIFSGGLFLSAVSDRRVWFDEADNEEKCVCYRPMSCSAIAQIQTALGAGSTQTGAV